jgi:large subunit ribosomal protein L46
MLSLKGPPITFLHRRTLATASPHSPYHISTAIVLNRSPILTRTPTQFEQAYYAYQARIRRSLHNPFPFDFYFKQGSLLETRFNLEERKRERLAFGPAFLEKESVSEDKKTADKAAVEQLSLQEGEGEDLMPRTHPADVNNDVKSLDRRGKRNLYLLLLTSQDGKDIWRFPQGEVEKGQLLHQVCFPSPKQFIISNFSVRSFRLLRKISMLNVVIIWTLGL